LLGEGVTKEEDFVIICECHDRGNGVLIVEEAWSDLKLERVEYYTYCGGG
jgi:hypothetical protein